MPPRWKHRPEGSTWGDFGPDDQIGRLNLLTPEKVKQGVAEVREGLAFCLSLPLDYPGGNKLNPRRHAPKLDATYRDGKPFMNFPLRKLDRQATDVISDDQVTLCLQYSTQWDSLAHVGSWFDADGDGEAERVYYNGYRADEHIVGAVRYLGEVIEDPCGPHVGAKNLGIENLAVKGIQGRGVMVDLHAHCGDARTAVGYDELMRVLEADRVTVETGDMLLLHTGFSALIMAMNRDPDLEVLENACACLDGRDERLLRWITDSGIAALIADNYAVELYPAKPKDGTRANLPLHEHCLFKLGVPLGELWWLRELATWLRANRRSRFLLTAPPLRLPGAVGSPATPVATV
ncbi:MAG TPA: cyclase family protein [Burkholderiales bacterium]|jgi:kynurenine formamidase|nr:cyclase family protein [Burkholderiales bacterium]